jgi:hypothetical protein
MDLSVVIVDVDTGAVGAALMMGDSVLAVGPAVKMPGFDVAPVDLIGNVGGPADAVEDPGLRVIAKVVVGSSAPAGIFGDKSTVLGGLRFQELLFANLIGALPTAFAESTGETVVEPAATAGGTD